MKFETKSGLFFSRNNLTASVRYYSQKNGGSSCLNTKKYYFILSESKRQIHSMPLCYRSSSEVTGDLCADLLSNIASEQRAKVVYEYLYRQIRDKKVRATIDFLLNREEAHNTMFREAFNKVQSTGSNRDFGTTKAATMYFSMSEPSPADSRFTTINGTPPSFQSTRR